MVVEFESVRDFSRERSMYSEVSMFDRNAKPDANTLTDSEKEGLKEVINNCLRNTFKF